jgi:hypothetical protein
MGIFFNKYKDQLSLNSVITITVMAGQLKEATIMLNNVMNVQESGGACCATGDNRSCQ